MSRSLASSSEDTADAVSHMGQVRHLDASPLRGGAHPNRMQSHHAGIVLLCSVVTQFMSHFVVHACDRQSTSTCNSLDVNNLLVQAMKLIDMFGKVHEACQRLRLDTSQLEATSLPDVHQLRLTLCAHTVQLLVPISCVSDINSSVIEPFRRTAVSNSLK